MQGGILKNFSQAKMEAKMGLSPQTRNNDCARGLSSITSPWSLGTVPLQMQILAVAPSADATDGVRRDTKTNAYPHGRGSAIPVLASPPCRTGYIFYFTALTGSRPKPTSRRFAGNSSCSFYERRSDSSGGAPWQLPRESRTQPQRLHPLPREHGGQHSGDALAEL